MNKKFLKPFLFLSVIILSTFLAIFFVRIKNIKVSQKGEQAIGGGLKHEASLAEGVTGPNIVPDKNPKPIEKTDSFVVTFSSDQAKAEFIKQNNLSSEKVVQIGQSNSYKINSSKDGLNTSIPGASVSPNVIYRASATPNDPLYSLQWNLSKVSAPAGWDITKGLASVKVAVIDGGFALNHEDLVGKFDIVNAYDYVHNDSSPNTAQDNPSGAGVSHATIVSGLVGASTDNSKGVASIGWNIGIIPIQALDDDGVGDTGSVASGIYRAVSGGAKVINMSLGSPSDDPVLKTAVDYATNNGVTVVAAAANDGCNCIEYPANYPAVIAVGATDANDVRASFSNYGANLDLVAPGSGTLRSTSYSAANPTSLYTTTAYGTSFSSPMVAGAAALIKSAKSIASPSDIEAYLRLGADKLSAMSGQNYTQYYGYGRMNIKNSLSYATSSNDYRWEYAGQGGPSSLGRGQKGTWTVSAKNVGSTTWYNSGANPVMLGTNNSRDRQSAFCTTSWFGCARPAKLNESSVPPGGIGTFTFQVQAPGNAGNYNEYFNLVAEGITWMNDPGLYFGTTVSNSSFSSSLVSNNFPASMASSSTASVTYTVKNTGTSYWYNDGKYPIRLGTYSPYDRSSQFNPGNWFGPTRPAQLTESAVAPGQNGTFTFQVKAPASNGSYTETYSLLAENLTWFNQGISSTVSVTGGSTPVTPPVNGYTSSMSLGQKLNPGQSLNSSNAKYKLVMQSDGNLVIYSPSRPIWASGTNGTSSNMFVLQTDSNMVIYSPSRATWSSSTVNRSANTLYMQDDGNLVLYDSQFRPIWASGTAGRV